MKKTLFILVTVCATLNAMEKSPKSRKLDIMEWASANANKENVVENSSPKSHRPKDPISELNCLIIKHSSCLNSSDEHAKQIEQKISNIPDINSKDNGGDSPLMLTARLEFRNEATKLKLIRLLINKGAKEIPA